MFLQSGCNPGSQVLFFFYNRDRTVPSASRAPPVRLPCASRAPRGASRPTYKTLVFFQKTYVFTHSRKKSSTFTHFGKIASPKPKRGANSAKNLTTVTHFGTVPSPKPKRGAPSASRAPLVRIRQRTNRLYFFKKHTFLRIHGKT